MRERERKRHSEMRKKKSDCERGKIRMRKKGVKRHKRVEEKWVEREREKIWEKKKWKES